MGIKENMQEQETKSLDHGRAMIAAAYWLDASPHEWSIDDGKILAQYARDTYDLLWKIKEKLPIIVQLVQGNKDQKAIGRQWLTELMLEIGDMEL